MNFIETRGNDGQRAPRVTFSEAILTPMSSFGGIYSPETLPQLGEAFLQQHLHSNYQTLAKALLQAFEIDIDESVIDEALELYRHFDDASNPVPVIKLNDEVHVVELWHGPTRAFKDMALQPFGRVLSALAAKRQETYLILAATSGDTGPAALDTFRNREHILVACLYPEGGTSDVQRLQMVTENASNEKVIGIRGNFDDAQKALKFLLSSTAFNATLGQKSIALSAANSVNFGRIIFQIIYHIHAYLELVRQGEITLGERVYLSVPSGNFGNALGGYFAMKMGLPVEKILIASNRNNVLTEWIREGKYDLRGKDLVATTSPAMDILKSSNVERILFDLFGAQRTKALMLQLDQENHYQLTADETAVLQDIFAADFCDDEQGLDYIKEAFNQGYVMDPHTATCLKTLDTCRGNQGLKTLVYSTAEWTKFSPVMVRALFGAEGVKDEDALQMMVEKAQVQIPDKIRTLFHQPITQKTLIEKENIEAEILAFLA